MGASMMFTNKFSIGDYILRYSDFGGGTLARVEDIDSIDDRNGDLVYRVMLVRKGVEAYWAVPVDDEDHARVVMSFVGPVPV